MRDLRVSPHAKLLGARKHLAVINDVLLDFLKEQPYRSVVEDRRWEEDGLIGHEWIYRGKILAELLPGISVRVGEFLYDLRSCLDHIAFALNGSPTGQDGRDAEWSEFPIFKDRTKYRELTKKGLPAPKSGLRKIQGMGDAAHAIVEGFQPYHREDRGEDPALDPLWQLQEMCNQDKHRTIHLVGAVLDAPQFTFQPLTSGVRLHDWKLSGGAFEDGAEIGRIRARFTRPNVFVKVNVDLGAKYNVAFVQPGHRNGPLVSECLTAMANRVLEVAVATEHLVTAIQ